MRSRVLNTMKRALVLGVIAVVIAVVPTWATTLVSVIDVFSTANDVVDRTFVYDPVTMGGALNIQTWGFGGSSGAPGGTNLAGFVVPSGGFDPIVQLWSGSGPTAAFVAEVDDGSCPPGTLSGGFCWDSTLVRGGLSAGTYTVTLTAFANFHAGSTLGAGFTGGGSFGGRTTTYALDVQAIPEPVTVLLLGSGLIGLGLLRRKTRRN